MAVLTPERKKLHNLLCDTLLSLCKNGLDYENNLRIDALIGITIDNAEVFLISLQDTIKNPEYQTQNQQPMCTIKQEPQDNVNNIKPLKSYTDTSTNMDLELTNILKGIDNAQNTFQALVLPSDEENSHLKLEVNDIDVSDDELQCSDDLVVINVKKNHKNANINPTTNRPSRRSNQYSGNYSFSNPSTSNYSSPELLQYNSNYLSESQPSHAPNSFKSFANRKYSAQSKNSSIYQMLKPKPNWLDIFDKKKRKRRSIFSNEQIHRLEEVFKEHQYVDTEIKKRLCEELGLSLFVVNVWFQNRRNRFKRSLNNTLT